MPTVVLPEPDSPTRPSTSPAVTSSTISIDDVLAGGDELDPQVADDDRVVRWCVCDGHVLSLLLGRCRSRRGRTRRSAGWSRSSARAIAMIGSSTPHGWTVSDSRFSLIIRPQSDCGGCRPRPRKLIPAISPIEYVSRRPNSTSSGDITFGSSSPKITRRRGSPTASAALMKSRSTTCWAAPRITRATRGACEMPTRQDDQVDLRPERGHEQQRQHDLRERHEHVGDPHQDLVPDAAEVGGGEADHQPEADADHRRRQRHVQHRPAAVQEAAPDVASERVETEQEVPPGARFGNPGTRSGCAARTAVRAARSPTITISEHEPDLAPRLADRRLQQRSATAVSGSAAR